MITNDEEQGRIHKLRQQLYSRDYKPKEDRRAVVTSEEVEGIQSDWKTPEEHKKKKFDFLHKQKEGFFIKWVLVLSIIFFLISFIIAALIFLRGGVDISSKNVDVRILGPVSIGGGEELSLEVIVDNKNNVDMESATVFIEYPEGTRSHENINKELTRDSRDYGPIGSGRNVRNTFKSVLFGEQDSVKEIKVVVEYRVAGSSATFGKEKNYEIQISSAPVLVNIKYPNQIRSDQDVEFIVDITSNSSTDLNNVLFKAEYPFGFSFVDSDPKPSFDKDVFSIGLLKPEERRTIKIRGTLQAQDNEERTFRFNIGTESENDERELGAVYVSSDKTIAVTKPSLGVSATINGSQSNEVAVRSGQSVSTVISWINNLTTRVVNANVSSSISGTMFEPKTVAVGAGGFYRSSNNTIVWDQNTQPDLAEISSGERGAVNFDFSVKNLTSSLGAGVRNPEINLNVDIEGTRFSEGNVPEQIQTTFSKKIKVASDLDLSARAVRTIGPIENTGPVPPKVDQTTTYTIIWSLTNSYNDVKNVRVVSQLPAYVEWEGVYSPNSENIFFNQTTNQVIWEIDNLPAGSGFSSSPKQVAFRVAVTPSVSQIDSSPIIIQQASAQGQDGFAGINLTDSAGSLTTNLETDPGVSKDDARVVD